MSGKMRNSSFTFTCLRGQFTFSEGVRDLGFNGNISGFNGILGDVFWDFFYFLWKSVRDLLGVIYPMHIPV